MSQHKTWSSVPEIFTELNAASCNYAVLRNYECMDTEVPFINGHDDIDLLCDDSRKIRKILGAKRRFVFPTVNSYRIPFKDYSVNVDIRFVGDGYYDENWERAMLASRALFDRCIYVLDQENYFYSLIYHAALQKNIFSTEYQTKLQSMAAKLGIPCQSSEELTQLLEQYMAAHGYYYTVTRDPGIVLKFNGIKKSRIRSNSIWLIKRSILNLLKRNRRIAQKYV